MADLSKAFQADNGISIDDSVAIFYGASSPAVVGEAAPIGSLYLRTTGELYQKVGLADTDWNIFTQGFDQLLRISASDTTSGYLSNKLLVSSSLTKTIQNSGANETLSIGLSTTGITPGTYRSLTIDAEGRATAGTNPTTLAGYGITDAQPLNANLTSISPLTTGGFVVRNPTTGAWGTKVIQGTTNQVSVANGTGDNLTNTTIGFSTTIQFPGVVGVIMPPGTTAQRINAQGRMRFNIDTVRMEYYTGAQWITIEPSTGGTVTSVSASSASQGITVTGSPITTSGTLTFGLANDLAAVEGLATTGIAVRTATDTWATRSLEGTADRLAVINGDGIAGNPTLDIAATYIGQPSITTVGTITAGTWNGTTISVSRGGTGLTSLGSSNQILGVNSLGTVLEYKTIATGTGIGITNTAGLITLTNTGVTSITGTANQVIASGATGAVTLSLPQSIGTSSSPSFAQVTVAADPTTALQVATKQYVDNLVAGLNPKQSVRVGTTSTITTLSGLQVIDGVTLIAGDRVLVKNQISASQNGIYVASAGAWTRASDLDTWAEVPGCFVFIEEGTTQADTAWLSTANQGGTLDSTAMPWVQFSSATDIAAGTGLTKTGNTLSITNIGTAGTYNNVTTNAQGQVISGSTVGYLTGNQTITLSGDVTGSGTVSIPTTLSNTGVTAGTYRSVTVDAKGRVTAATNPTTLAGYGITDAQPLDADLTAIAAQTGTGIAVRTAADTWALRTILAGSTRLSITNGSGVGGNISIDAVEANFTLNNIGGTLGLTKGGTGLAAAGSANQILGMNSGATALEYKTIIAGTGINVSNAAGTITISSTGGTVTSVAVTGSTGLTVSGSPITSAGTISLTLGTELQGLSSLSSAGIVVRTGAGTYTSRSVTSSGTLTVTNPAGTAGNIGIDLVNIGTAGTYRSVTTDAFGRVTSGTNPTTLAGYGITDAIPTSEKGAANGVATLDSAGLIPTSQLPPLAISDVFTVANQTAMLALTAQRGDFAVRTDLGTTFVLAAEPASTLSNWVQITSGTTGTVTSVAATAPAQGLTITGSPITSSGTLSFSLANDLAALEGLATTGIAVRTGTDTWASRTLVAGTGITISNANGVAGNITIATINNGTVTSVGLALPSIFAVVGSPITTAGTLTAALNTQAANTVFAGPVSGAAATPSFRTLGLDEMNDVVLTAPSTNQVLAYNGSNWVNTGAVGANAAGLIGVGQSAPNNWVLVSGTTYRADFAHNLGTTNVVITVFNSATNAVVIPNSIVLTDANTVRITVTGNTLTLRVVVVANGQSIVAGGSTPSSVITAKDGVDVVTASTRLNFTGQAVQLTNAGSGVTNINVGARYSYFANSLDTPNNSDFAVAALAPVTTDPSFASLNVRSFSNTVEQGVAFTCSIPPGATTMTFKFRGRSQVGAFGTTVVQPRLYYRLLPNNAAVGTWSAAQELANITLPSNVFFQYAQQTVALSTLGLVADRLYQFELTRRVTGVTGTNNPSAFLLAELTIEFA